MQAGLEKYDVVVEDGDHLIPLQALTRGTSFSTPAVTRAKLRSRLAELDDAHAQLSAVEDQLGFLYSDVDERKIDEWTKLLWHESDPDPTPELSVLAKRLERLRHIARDRDSRFVLASALETLAACVDASSSEGNPNECLFTPAPHRGLQWNPLALVEFPSPFATAVPLSSLPWLATTWTPFEVLRILTAIIRRATDEERRILRSWLRFANNAYLLVLRALEAPQRLHEFLSLHRAWHLRHGAHPPRVPNPSSTVSAVRFGRMLLAPL